MGIVLWIVEERMAGGDGEWRPVFDKGWGTTSPYCPFTTRAKGLIEVDMWRMSNPEDSYRLRKYVRATP